MTLYIWYENGYTDIFAFEGISVCNTVLFCFNDIENTRKIDLTFLY